MRLRSARFLFPLLALGMLAGCGNPRSAPVTFRWWTAHEAPAFDPDGPPDALRHAMERLLTRALVSEDSLGRPTLDAAEHVEVSANGLRYTFRLRRGLRFTDGAPCEAASFRDGARAGLGRSDHATRSWLLAAVRGVDAIRPRRALPEVGIHAPDPATVVFELTRPDTAFLRKLASPGASSAWKSREAGASWAKAVGLGPYRVASASARAVSLVRALGDGPDTVAIRFGANAARTRAALRTGAVDMVWPLPPGMLNQALPAAFAARSGAARPTRRLTLVLRADVPPTTRLAARRAFAHGIARGELVRQIGRGAREIVEWLPGGGRAELPGLDRMAVQDWLDRGKLGRSFHVRLAYDGDGTGADLARALQGDLARSGLSADLVPLRGAAWSREALLGQAQALLVEEQGLVAGPIGMIAPAVLPIRGPAVGAYRTGWRTREFDAWLLARNPLPAFDVGWAEGRLEEETIVVPVCGLDWVWIEPTGAPRVAIHPRFGPGAAGSVTLPEPAALDR